jgi:lipid-binding SYLF domain-containing protein
MKNPRAIIPLAIAIVVSCIGAPCYAQILEPAAMPAQPAVVATSPEDAIVNSATAVLNEIMSVPAQGIPRALLNDAQAIVIAPGVLKGGFVIGARHGRGVVVIRDENGNWRAPSFISITGGSIGWQVGVQAIDVILVFKTQNSVQGLLAGKFTLGGDVAVAAGPVGREASAATDARLNAEIYSYSRSRGLFVGAALDGSMISVDNNDTAAYYRGTGLLPGDGPPVQAPQLPPSAAKLLAAIAMYTTPEAAPAQVVEPARTALAVPSSAPAAAAMAPGGNPLPANLQAIGGALLDSWGRLARVLDANWQRYLALPAEIANRSGSPSPQSISATLDRFSAVATDPKYSALAQRAEFQETLGLLKSYRDLQSATLKSTLALPPPPR